MAQISLGILGLPSEKNIIIDSLVVGDINRVMMVGASTFTKKLAKKVSLADYRFLTSKSDEVKIDLLVGNEHRYKVISPRALPLQLYSIFCPRTVFGDIVLSGTIPGPGSISSNISNNVVTLFNISCSLPTLPILEETEEVF